jgi:hypothetical protein
VKIQKTLYVLQYGDLKSVCGSVKRLQLPVDASYKSPLNPTTNLNHVSSH